MIEQLLGSKMHRALVARQVNSAALQICLTNCLTTAVYESMNTCNFDVTCMCGNDGFRNSTMTCAKAQCDQAGTQDAAFESALTSVMDSCAGTGFVFPTATGDNDIIPTTTRKPTTYTPTRSSPSKDDNEPTQSSSSKDDSGPSTGLIVGAVVGGLVLVSLFGILIWWLVRRNKRRAALENKPAFHPNSGPVTPVLDDGKIDGGAPPMPQANQPGGFVVGYNGQPYYQYSNTTASTNYASSTATGPTGFGVPQAELGYIPPSQFGQFGAGAVGAASFASTYPATASSSGGSSSGVQLLTTASPPSQSGSSSSRPGTSDTGVGGFNPYFQQQQPPLQLHQAQHDPYAGASASADTWPADVKRPLNVMSADETPHQQAQQQQGELPPPMYTRE